MFIKVKHHGSIGTTRSNMDVPEEYIALEVVAFTMIRRTFVASL